MSKPLKKNGKKYDPNQPRDPGGEGGGQWTSEGGGGDKDPSLISEVREERKASGQKEKKTKGSLIDEVRAERGDDDGRAGALLAATTTSEEDDASVFVESNYSPEQLTHMIVADADADQAREMMDHFDTDLDGLGDELKSFSHTDLAQLYVQMIYNSENTEAWIDLDHEMDDVEKAFGRKFDPSKHPHVPAGNKNGGQWASTGADNDAAQSEEKTDVGGLETKKYQNKIDVAELALARGISAMLGQSEIKALKAKRDEAQEKYNSYVSSIKKSANSDGLEKSGEVEMSKRLLFVPITKMDEEKRLVYGVMADETPDRADEIFDYESSKPHFEKWSGDIHKASDGKSYGNVRVMHTAKAAGKLDQIAFNDEAKEIECVAKVVDDDEWKKCLEGVYTGFSIGGKYVKKWKDGNGKYRYTASPAEVSLVDSSCNTSCNFTLQKADGSTVEIAFKPYIPDNSDVAAQAEALAKAAGLPNKWGDYVDEARELLVKMHEGLDDALGEELAKAAEEKTEDKGEKKKFKKKGEKSDKAEGEEETAAEDKDAEEETEEGDEVDKAAVAEQALGEVEQVWKSTDGKTFGKKADAVAHQGVIIAQAITDPVKKALADLKKSMTEDDGVLLIGAEAGTPEVFANLSKAHQAITGLASLVEDNDILEKSLYDVQTFASALQQIAYVQEGVAWAGSYDNKEPSEVAVALKDQVAGLCGTFIRLAIEECAGLVARLKPTQIDQIISDSTATQQVDPTMDPEVGVAVAQAVKFLKEENNILAKRGARNSKRDAAQLQKAHDALISMGAACADKSLEKLDGTDDLAKMATVVAENEELKKTLGTILPEIAELKKIADEWKKAPAQGAPRTHVVEKGDDLKKDASTVAGEGLSLEDIAKNYTPDQIAAAYIRLSQQRPQDAMNRG